MLDEEGEGQPLGDQGEQHHAEGHIDEQSARRGVVRQPQRQRNRQRAAESGPDQDEPFATGRRQRAARGQQPDGLDNEDPRYDHGRNRHHHRFGVADEGGQVDAESHEQKEDGVGEKAQELPQIVEQLVRSDIPNSRP